MRIFRLELKRVLKSRLTWILLVLALLLSVLLAYLPTTYCYSNYTDETGNEVKLTGLAYHERCMMERNKFMVDHADILLAVCRKIPRSGTEATINYARKMNKEVIMIDPFARRLIHENPTTESNPNR